VLVTLARRPDQVLGHAELVDLVWRDAYRGNAEVKLESGMLRSRINRSGRTRGAHAVWNSGWNESVALAAGTIQPGAATGAISK
jgi:hypothetical protein